MFDASALDLVLLMLKISDVEQLDRFSVIFRQKFQLYCHFYLYYVYCGLRNIMIETRSVSM